MPTMGVYFNFKCWDFYNGDGDCTIGTWHSGPNHTGTRVWPGHLQVGWSNGQPLMWVGENGQGAYDNLLPQQNFNINYKATTYQDGDGCNGADVSCHSNRWTVPCIGNDWNVTSRRCLGSPSPRESLLDVADKLSHIQGRLYGTRTKNVQTQNCTNDNTAYHSNIDISQNI